MIIPTQEEFDSLIMNRKALSPNEAVQFAQILKKSTVCAEEVYRAVQENYPIQPDILIQLMIMYGFVLGYNYCEKTEMNLIDSMLEQMGRE
jgi:hypothetical protein